ncbi:PREDICTED: uncharacterized protein LOC107104473 [Cyprinodon variegatus]|uniref:uncharacterized protein LOC107104473 n=1 Tax=Cyprinodon variegatus TaxID=28743 RepID=UPI0007428E10|nr:PREDICTED: uncharacterized protein LOC107104473 [Cyprinodon variegatus]
MLMLIIFCYVLFQIPDEIDSLENVQGPQAGSFGYLASLSTSAVIRYSVLEDQHVCLPCGASASSNVIWTHQNRKVLVDRQGSHKNILDPQHYDLLDDGGLCVLKLHDSDSGEYQCNQQLVAELQVLNGHDLKVPAGWTLLLACRGSPKLKHKWMRHREGQNAVVIFTRFKDGTEKAETDESRLSYENDSLQIRDLQLDDAGEYICNRIIQAKLTVLQENPASTSILPALSTSITTVSAVPKTDVFETNNTPKKRPENALLLVTVIGSGLMIVLIALVCIFLTSMKCRNKRRQRYAAKRREDTELQLWMTYNAQTEYEVFERPTLPDETIHYASLGRQSWSQRPSWLLDQSGSNNVVYSSVITRPGAKNTFT